MADPPFFRKPRDPILDDPTYKTCVPDARFHNSNATNWCFTMFVDYKKCLRLLGEKNPCCAQFEKIYKSICPYTWIDKWEEQIQEGTFPVDLPPQKSKHKSNNNNNNNQNGA